MFSGSEDDRRAILKASEIVGQVAKYSFIGIVYLGVAIGVSIKVGTQTLKIIKAHMPDIKKEKGGFNAEEEII